MTTFSFSYNIDYWDRMLRQNSPTAFKINKIRWNFIKPAGAKRILDYGSGCGFFRAFKPKDINVDTFDINPWPQTGMGLGFYDLITFWDVLEHIENLDEFLKLDLAKINFRFLAFSVPALPEGTEVTLWKHYKPGEHFHYKTVEEWDKLFYEHGFSKIKSGWPEGEIRADIYSALFKKKT